MKKILIVEDDIHIGNVLEEALSREGYSVTRAYSGTEAKLILSERTPDLILLDLMLPGLSGEEILPEIHGIPTIVLSAKIGIDDKVNVLRSGAVDYVTKPFSMRELSARIEVHLKNYSTPPVRLSFDLLELDTVSHSVFVAGKSLKLTRTEYAILKLLMQNCDQVIARSTLLDRIGSDTPDCTESSLKIHISNLRRKIREACGKEYIESVWGIGYKLGVGS